MEIKEYMNMYQKMEISDELDDEIRNGIKNRSKHKIKDKRKIYSISTIVAVAITLIILSINTSVVSAGIEKVVKYFSYSFIVSDSQGNTEEVTMNEEYFDLSDTAPLRTKKYDSFTEVGSVIGVELLESNNYYSYDGCVTYSPNVENDNEITGITIMDYLYCTGDLDVEELYKSNSAGGVDSLEFEAGEQYSTPILAQISIQCYEDLSEDYDNNEVGFVSDESSIDLTKESYNAELYYLEKFDIEVVMYDIQTDGPCAWEESLSGEITLTNAVFVYQGIEYCYAGGVDHDTMKEFLETLE